MPASDKGPSLGMRQVLGVKGIVITLVSFGIFLGLLLMAFLQYAKFGSPGSCSPNGFYMTSEWNQWRSKYMQPPMSLDKADQGLCGHSSSPGGGNAGTQFRASYGDYGNDANGEPMSVPEDTTTIECNGGSFDAASFSDATAKAAYTTRAQRFNECMRNVHRHYGTCAPHVDCGNEFVERQHPQDYAFSTDGTRCPFLYHDDFFTACEAKTQYADFRDQYKLVLLFT